MSVLLLRLAGPMQSWGTQSRFTVRDAGREPSKSGVVGLLCAALGRPRAEPVADLAGLRMAVRVDQEGRLARDYHTALDVIKADGSGTTTVVSNRYYLADADFLVGLESDDRALLDRLDAALRSPVWPLYLGRKSFVPGEPVPWPADAAPIRDAGLMDVVRSEPWRPRGRQVRPPDRLRYALEVGYGQGEPRQDQPEPLSFATRHFAVRHVKIDYIPTPASVNPHVPQPPVPGPP